jgi:TolB-like protein/Flp pilus assembly protein TadD
MPQTADVFISYSREDKDRVIDLAQKLREAGVSLWIDQGGIDGAAMWSEEIVNALENSKVLMLMVSEHSVTSHNVTKEVTIASERKGHILPVHLEPTRIPAGLKYALAGIQHIEYFATGPEEATKSILRSLERLGVEIRKAEPVAAGGSVATPQMASHSMDSVSAASIPDSGIAVLPFENSSPDPDADYFSDGLTDELIASLSKVGELELVSRLTSVQYKNTKKDARTIGSELQARYIVTGTVRKFQENLRIAAQMVDAKTNKQLWAETYKGKLEDIFDIQEQVAKQIADALKLKLSVSEKVGLTKRRTMNAEAFDLYLRGKDYLYRLTRRSAVYSLQLFEKAIELDPRYAAAYAGCSEAYGQLYSLFERKESNREKAQELSFKALMYDNTLPEAYATLGFSYLLRGEYEDALSACNKAMELDPDSFSTYWILGRIYYATDRSEEAIRVLEKVARMNPKFYAAYNDLKLAYNAVHDAVNADRLRGIIIDFFPSFILQNPDDARARMIYACNLAEAGRKDEAVVQLTTAVELDPDDSVMMFNAACTFAQLGENSKSIAMLRGSIDAGNSNFDWVKRDSDLDPIRNDPEYIELMKDK